VDGDPTGNGHAGDRDGTGAPTASRRDQVPRRPTLNAAVRRRRADRAFYLRLAGAIRQNERAIERMKR
jgi:hypothetical protein